MSGGAFFRCEVRINIVIVPIVSYDKTRFFFLRGWGGFHMWKFQLSCLWYLVGMKNAFFFFGGGGGGCSLWKFQGQGLNLSHNSDKAESLMTMLNP